MADITELQSTDTLNANENKFLISSAVTDAQSNSGTPSTSSTGLFDPQVAIAQSASNTEPNEFNTTSTGGTVSDAVTDAQNSSNSTGILTGTSDSDLTLSPVTTTATRTSVQQVIPNPLHNLASYTYSLSLHLLDSATYNGLVENPGGYTPNNVLIASGGRRDSGFSWTYNQSAFPRNSSFNEDFYFDELRLTTFINKAPRNTNSNAIDINFTIIEPNGFTLINRLLDACTQIGCKNYLMQPYLLQIDFMGYTDDGLPTGNVGHTKRIPIMLIGMKTRIASKGTEYRIQAAPYNHRAFNDSMGRAPTNFQIKASTLSTFFGKGGSQSPANVGDRTADADTIVSLNNTNKDIVLDQVAEDQGYVNALNTWNRYLQESNNKTTFDEFNVVFAPEILAKQSIVDKKRNPTGVVADKQVGNTTKPDWSKQYFSVNAGTSVEKVIDMAMRNSEFILSQVTDPSTDSPQTLAQKTGKPLQWFKVVPKVELKGWDFLANDYAKKITYYVKVWTVNNKHPDGPIGVTPGAVKEYNYIYTGKNSDVLDLSIDFDMTYYVQKVVDRNKQQDVNGAARKDPNDKEASVSVVPTPGVVNPIRMVYVAQDVQENGQMGGTQTPARQTVGAISRNLNEKSNADMINVKLKILGDPTFIKQDDLFAQQTAQASNSYLVNNSVVMDDGELYVMVKFNTPVDYDERYGLVTAFDQDSGDQRYGYNMFSGKYAVVTIDNIFTHGKFEQTLDLVRLHYQPEYDNLNGTAYPIGGATWFRTPDFGRTQFPIMQGFAGGALPTGAVLTGLLAGGTGLISGIASTAINNGITYATNAISTAASNFVNEGISNLKDWWNAPSISWENIGTGGFENLVGGGATEGLLSGEVTGIGGLSDWGTVNTGQLINSEVGSMASGLGGADLGGGGLDILPSGVSLGDTSFGFNFDFDFDFGIDISLGDFF